MNMRKYPFSPTSNNLVKICRDPSPKKNTSHFSFNSKATSILSLNILSKTKLKLMFSSLTWPISPKKINKMAFFWKYSLIWMLSTCPWSTITTNPRTPRKKTGQDPIRSFYNNFTKLKEKDLWWILNNCWKKLLEKYKIQSKRNSSRTSLFKELN